MNHPKCCGNSACEATGLTQVRPRPLFSISKVLQFPPFSLLRKGPEARPLSEVSAQSRPQLNSGIMNRMTGLLSRMLNEPRQRHTRSDENSFDRVSEGISILFGNEAGNAPSSDDAPSTSATAGEGNVNNDTSPSKESTKDSSSSSSSEDDALAKRPKYDYLVQKFLGHRNARTMIKEANFWGDDFVSFSMEYQLPSSSRCDFLIRFSAEATAVTASCGVARQASSSTCCKPIVTSSTVFSLISRCRSCE